MNEFKCLIFFMFTFFNLQKKVYIFLNNVLKKSTQLLTKYKRNPQ